MRQRLVVIVAPEREHGEMYRFMLAPDLGVWAADLSAAQQRLREAAYDAVLFDVMHPAEWADCEALAQIEGAPPVVVVTGWVQADRRFRTQAFAAGCAAFILKPCRRSVLREALDRVLAGERGLEYVAGAFTAAPAPE